MSRINGLTLLLFSLMLCMATLPACRVQPTGTIGTGTVLTTLPEDSPQLTNPVNTGTRFTPLPGDSVQMVSGLMVQMTLDDLISQSDTIIVGKVIEILRPQWGTSNTASRIIYTDVIVKPERFLYGFKADKIAIRVEGGRIGTTAMIVEDQPEFTLGEDILLFLSLPKNLGIRPPDRFGLADYYSVTGSLQGKWAYDDGKAVNMYGAVHDVSALEKRISELRPGEQPPATFVRPAHAGTPLVYFERNYLLGGKEAHLSIYEDGTAILDEAIGTRMAINGFTRCWFTGKLSAEELTKLKAYFDSIGFYGLPEHYVYESMTFADLGITVETNIGGVTKTVTSMGYWADSLPDIFRDVYNTLIAITYDLKFVGSEHIT